MWYDIEGWDKWGIRKGYAIIELTDSDKAKNKLVLLLRNLFMCSYAWK